MRRQTLVRRVSPEQKREQAYWVGGGQRSRPPGSAVFEEKGEPAGAKTCRGTQSPVVEDYTP